MKRFMVLVASTALSLCLLSGCQSMTPVTAYDYELQALGMRLNPYSEKVKQWLGPPPAYDGEPRSFSDGNFTISYERPKYSGAGYYQVYGEMIPTQKARSATCVPVVYLTCVDKNYKIVEHYSLIVSTVQENGTTKFLFRGSVNVNEPFVWSTIDYFLPM